MTGLLHDIRYAVRGLTRNPGFTTVAVLTLALGIGANTAMFSVLNAVLLRPLPYRSPEQLAMLFTEIPSQQLREGRSAYQDVEQWRMQSKSFADIAVFDPASATLTRIDRSEQISVARVSPNLFSLLGVQLARGRNFTAEEAEQRQRVSVISHPFWQTRLGGSSDALGATIELDGVPSRVIGILPAGFQFGDQGVWEPHTMFPDWETRRRARGAGSWFVIGRLRPNVTFDQAQTEMNAIARHLDGPSSASDPNRGISVVPLTLHVTGSTARLALWMLAGAVFCVLVIAVTNIAGLTLARSAGREREIAIRSALGASRARVIRQLLAESVTLAVLSGIAGLLVASMTMRVVLAMKPANLARLDALTLDARVLSWTLALSCLTGVLIGLAPALTTVRRNMTQSFRERGGSSGSSTRRLHDALVVAEFALAIVLLVGAGLLTRSLQSVERVDPGFKSDRVLSIQISSPASWASAQRVEYYQRVLEQVQAVGGVEHAGIIGDLIVGGSPEQTISIEGGTSAVSERLRLRRDEVSDDFFATLGTPLIRGRLFSGEDRPDSPRVAIVNAAMARRLWSEVDAVGERFKLGAPGSTGPWFTVVGVVGDMRRQGPERDPMPQMFEPLAQNPSRNSTLLVRTSGDPVSMVGTLEAAVRRVDKHVPIYGVTTLTDRFGAFNTERRFQTSVLVAFAVVALVLAAIGIYGLIQYSIVTRTREIGVRMAVGAQAGDIFRMVLREGLQLGLMGLALGLVGALALGQVVSSLLFGVTATDPPTFVAVSVLLTAVAAAACYLPARRAARLDPLVALRYE
ncbi:MAG TPA: ABC transporter permease [Vicinamibacterales bacterium]|nr:ABC transporter permease [Vicinamibacterales bacterium]